MNTKVHPASPASSRAARKAVSGSVCSPSYDWREQREAATLQIYVPGVDAAGVDIEARGPDLIVTAKKHHFVRVNWSALHLETAQRDYHLKLRLGTGYAYADMHAEISDGVLTVTLPKLHAAAVPTDTRKVA